MANSKMLYNSYELITPLGNSVSVCSNEVRCNICKLIFKSKRAFYNHTQNNGCHGQCDLSCFCDEPLNNHFCKMLGSCRCAFCGFSFKNVESGINHCMNSHKDGSFFNISEFLIYDDLTHVNPKFDALPEAQCTSCKSHWNFGQFEKWWSTGDNATKRMLTRKVLIQGHLECSILELISIRGKLIAWKKKPQKHNAIYFDITTTIGILQVHLDKSQVDFQKIYRNIEPLIKNYPVFDYSCFDHFPQWKKFLPEAQSLFDINVNHNISVQPIIDQLSSLAQSTFSGDNLRKVMSLITKIGICYASGWNSTIIGLSLLDFFLNFDVPIVDANEAVRILISCLPLVIALFIGRNSQSNEEDIVSKESFTALATLVSVVFGTMFLKSVPKSSSIDDFVMSATKFGNFMRAMDNSWKGLGKLVSFLYDYCFEYFHGYCREIGEAEKFISGIEVWAMEVGKVASNDILENIQTDAVLCRHIERLYLQGVTFVTRSAHLKLPMDMKRSIENCQRIIAALNDKVSKSGAFSAGPKVEPLIIQLFGESGVGKSGMMYLLAGDILKTEDILCGGDGTASEDWANQIYPRNVEQEFFDGYRNQLIVLYDDFGQLRDSQAKPNTEFMEMIRFGNLAPMCLHMAALEQKDKTYFSSKCVLLSSNCQTYAIESLISKDAFHRRIDMSVEVRVLEEYRLPNSQKLDAEAVVQKFGSPLVPEIYECRLWCDNGNGSCPSPIWIKFDCLRDIVCRNYAKKMNRHFELTNVLSAYMQIPLKLDIGKIKDELDKKFKVVSPKHFTMSDLSPVAQSDDYFDAVVEQNCSPMFPECIRKTSALNAKRWKKQRFDFEIYDTTTHLAYVHESEKHHWHLQFTPFEDCLMDALEEVNGDWKRVLNFLSAHMSFLNIKTQIAFARPEFQTIFQDPETAIDFLSDGNLVCENDNCWHPKLGGEKFGFQSGCEKSLLEFMLQRMNNRDNVFYDIFMDFQIVEPNAQQKVSKKILNIVNVIKDSAIGFLKDCATWCKENIEITVMLGYFSICAACMYGAYRSSYSSSATEYEVARDRYNSAYKVYRDAVNGLREAEVNLTHKHEGLELGTVHKHAHACEKCGMTFVHSHLIKPEEISMKFPHLCYRCRKISSEFQSGDNVTTHQVRAKVETSQSGDNITTHLPKAKVEAVDTYKEFLHEVMLESNVEDEDFLSEKVSETIHKVNPISAEMASDPNAMTLGKRIYVNTYMISTRNNSEEEWKQHVNCVFLRGRVAVTVGHLEPILVSRSGGEIKIDGPFKPDGYCIPINQLRFKKLQYANGEEKDAMIIIFPNVIHDHQDILNAIVDSETMGKFSTIPAMLITPTVIKDRNIYNQRFATATAINNENPLPYIDRNITGGLRYLRMHYQYIMNTSNGDCGSLLIALSNYLPKKIIGIHVAGDATGKGYAVPLNIRDIEDALKDVPRDAQIKIDLCRFEKEEGELSSIPDGDFTPAIKSNLLVASPSKTALRKSMIHGKVLPVISAPAVLSRRVVLESGEIHDPVLAGLKKTGKIPPFMEPNLIKAAVNDVLRIHQTSDKTRKRVLTNEEALAGVSDDIYSNPLNRSSSPGYPWIKTRVGKGKMKWTSDPQGEYKMHEELEKALIDRENMALNNERYPTIWIDTLKDERRPLEKVKVGKTRVFAAGPMDYVVAARKYYLGFCAHVAENRINNEIAVGINPYSFDWTHLARHLKKFGLHVVAGDFGNFDGTLILQILDEIGKAINEWYGDGEENQQIRAILWKELINSIHIEGDNIYFWTHGHPSGHPLTAILNSLYNSVVCRIVFILCARKVGKIVNMKDFNENVSMISYGDDNVLNISERVVGWFNQHTMTETFSEIGMEYTDELKSSATDAKAFRTLDEVSFLKRKFRYDQERSIYTAPLEYGVCMEMVNWIRGELDPEEACGVNCQTSAMELSLHGREIFEKSTKLIKQACVANIVKQPIILTYGEYVEFFNTSYGQMMAPNPELRV